MSNIFKYGLQIQDQQTIQLPADAKILTAQIQFNELNLWALVNPSNGKDDRTIVIMGTGHDIREDLNLKYISTVQLMGGNLIYHIFELIK